MGFLSVFKTPLLGLITMTAYSSMVIDIIGIVKEHTGSHNRPNAVIAMLVVSILQLVYCVALLATSGKALLGRAKHVIAAFGFFFLFNFASIVATAVLYEKGNSNYCPPSSTIRSDCAGVMRGVMGLGFSLLGLDLIYMGFVATLARTYGTLNDPIHELPPRRLPNADMNDKPAA